MGYHIARSLYDEGYNLSIIDNDPKACDRAESFDALILRGNAASPKKLEEAGIATADVFIGVTGSDEINMAACSYAHSRNCKTIARINSQDYIDEPISTKAFKHMGIDVAVCPELLASIKMARMLTMPSVVDTEVFARGKVQIIEEIIRKDSAAAGKSLSELSLPNHCNLVAVFRRGEVIIPRGSDVLEAGDRVVLTLADKQKIIPVKKLFVGSRSLSGPIKVKKVMINGATRIGMNLSKLLEDELDIVLLEDDDDESRKASEGLLRTLVIHGSGTDEELLMDEGIDNVDAFISTTTHEGVNILSCILAKQYGAKKTVALIDRPELKLTMQHTGIDIVVSPRIATVSGILQHIHHKKMLSLSVLNQGDARILEMKVSATSKIAGKSLKKVHFPRNTLVGAIVRGDKVIIPQGDDGIRTDDSLIIFAKNEEVSRLMELF